MAPRDIKKYMSIVPAVLKSPKRFVWSSYDAEADVVYINFERSEKATDSELTDNDIIVRYKGKNVIGLTILHASQR